MILYKKKIRQHIYDYTKVERFHVFEYLNFSIFFPFFRMHICRCVLNTSWFEYKDDDDDDDVVDTRRNSVASTNNLIVLNLCTFFINLISVSMYNVYVYSYKDVHHQNGAPCIFWYVEPFHYSYVHDTTYTIWLYVFGYTEKIKREFVVGLCRTNTFCESSGWCTKRKFFLLKRKISVLGKHNQKNLLEIEYLRFLGNNNYLCTEETK